MPKTQSERRRLKGVTVNLFAADISLGWRVARQVPVELALEKLALKQWREIWLDNGELAGVQPLKPVEHKTFNQVLIEGLLAVTITLPELKRNAGLYGRSHTIGMAEWKRLQRHVWEKTPPTEPGGLPVYVDTGKIADPEDATERAIAKVRIWPLIRNIEPGLQVQVMAEIPETDVVFHG